MSQEIHYYFPYLRNAATRPVLEVIGSVIFVLSAYLFLGYFAVNGYATEVLCGFMVPKVIAATWLAYAYVLTLFLFWFVWLVAC